MSLCYKDKKYSSLEEAMNDLHEDREKEKKEVYDKLDEIIDALTTATSNPFNLTMIQYSRISTIAIQHIKTVERDLDLIAIAIDRLTQKIERLDEKASQLKEMVKDDSVKSAGNPVKIGKPMHE